MELWWLLLFLAQVFAVAVTSEDDPMCASVKQRPTYSLQHCKFLRDAGAPVTDITPLFCDLLSGGKNHPEVLDSTIYFHARYVFTASSPFPLASSVLEDDGEDTLRVCVCYVDLVYEKLLLDREWTNVTFGNYTYDGFAMLTALRNLRFEMTFDVQVPVGFLVIDRKCWQQVETRSESCLLDVRLLQEVMSFNTSVSAMDPVAFTAMLRKMLVATLYGHAEEFYIDINPEISMLTQTYVTHMLTYLGFNRLHISGGRWDLLENMLPQRNLVLTVLELPKNRIKTIAEGNFWGLQILESLDLSNNRLTSLPNNLRYLHHLRSLELSGNTFLLSDAHNVVTCGLILKDLKSLQSLSLSRIEMKRLDVLDPILTFPSMISLIKLNVSRCGLEFLPSFWNQRELLVLDLSGNRLRDVVGADLHLLPNLKVLNLARNKITRTLKLDLGVDNLQLLDLSENTIKDPAAVVVNKPVIFLDLSRNNVSNWTDPQALDGYARVNLSLNVITGASDVMCRSLSALQVVDLGGNVFNCDDCRMPALQECLRDNVSEFLNLGTNTPLTCSLPKTGVPVVNYTFDDKSCLVNPPSLWSVVGVPVTSAVVIALLAFTVLYRFRVEIKYFSRRSFFRRKTKNRDDADGVDDVYKYDAFVSYSRSDRWWVVDELSPNMEQSADKYRLCLHERDFALGSLIFDNIEESMKSSRFMIVVLSNNFLESQWCRWELDMVNLQAFSNDNDFLILVELEPLRHSKLPKRLRLLMDTHTSIVWPRGGDETLRLENQFWCRLRQAIGSSLYSFRQDRTLMMALQP